MNIQQTIIEGIKEQLFFNDFLVLPKFGGFVLKYRPARFSAAGGQLLPPTKTVSFNVQLKQNDGILALWLSAKLGCSVQEALQHLSDFSGYCSGILNTKRRLNIAGIGFFYLDFEENICFEPAHDVNFLRDSFGLGAVPVQPLQPAEATPKAVITPVYRQAAAAQPAQQLKRPALTRAAVALTIGLVFFFIVLVLLSGSRLRGELQASLFGGATARSYQPLAYPALVLRENTNRQKEYVADSRGIASVEVAKNRFLYVRVNENPAAPESFNTSDAEHYEVVLGCFSVLNNAHKLVRQLGAEDQQVRIAGRNSKGMYVVSKGSFTSKQKALQELAEIKGLVPSAWIKKSR